MPPLFQSPAKPKKSMTSSTIANRHDHMGPLTVFAVNPDGVKFETQEEAEEVVLFLRQHLIVLVPAVLIVALLLLAPPVLFPLLISALGNLPVSLPQGYTFVGGLFWYLATFGFA